MKRRPPTNRRNEKKWMTTFTDMTLIILVFFIMLFSISVVDAQRFRALTNSFEGPGVFDGLTSIFDSEVEKTDTELSVAPELDLPQKDEAEADEQMDELVAELEGYLVENDLEEMITATREERGVLLVLQEQLLFDTGEAYILEEAKPFLDKIISILAVLPNRVDVEGHTDSRPIDTYRYPSNWELSGARASSVIRYFIEEGDLSGERFVATGYGETRPIVTNDSVENMQKNRRVIVLISDPSYEDSRMTSEEEGAVE